MVVFHSKTSTVCSGAANSISPSTQQINRGFQRPGRLGQQKITSTNSMQQNQNGHMQNSSCNDMNNNASNHNTSSRINRQSFSQADMHIQKMPVIIEDGKPMAVWTDIKEIIFPSCSDALCDIVLMVIKEIVGYPDDESDASPCTPKQQMAFLRNFRIVPCGTLLVNTRLIQEKLNTLKNLVRTRHLTSEELHSQECHYSIEHGNHDNMLTPDEKMKTEFQRMKSEANNHFCWCVLPFTDISEKLKDDEPDPIIYNDRYLLPAMKLSFRPFVPMSLVYPYFKQFYSYLFDLCRDHLIGAGGDVTKCLSYLEANCVSSYIARKQGWGSNWHHITSRDIMIDWQILCKHVKNPPTLTVESPDLSNNVAMVTPLQILYDADEDHQTGSQMNNAHIGDGQDLENVPSIPPENTIQHAPKLIAQATLSGTPSMGQKETEKIAQNSSRKPKSIIYVCNSNLPVQQQHVNVKGTVLGYNSKGDKVFLITKNKGDKAKHQKVPVTGHSSKISKSNSSNSKSTKHPKTLPKVMLLNSQQTLDNSRNSDNSKGTPKRDECNKNASANEKPEDISHKPKLRSHQTNHRSNPKHHRNIFESLTHDSNKQLESNVGSPYRASYDFTSLKETHIKTKGTMQDSKTKTQLSEEKPSQVHSDVKEIEKNENLMDNGNTVEKTKLIETDINGNLVDLEDERTKDKITCSKTTKPKLQEKSKYKLSKYSLQEHVTAPTKTIEHKEHQHTGRTNLDSQRRNAGIKLGANQLKEVNRRTVNHPPFQPSRGPVLLPNAKTASRTVNAKNKILQSKDVDVVGSILHDSMSSQRRFAKLSRPKMNSRDISREAPYREILFQSDEHPSNKLVSLVSASPFAPGSERTWKLLNLYDSRYVTQIRKVKNQTNKENDLKPDNVEKKPFKPILAKSCEILPSQSKGRAKMDTPRKSVSSLLHASEKAKYKVKCDDLKLTFTKIQDLAKNAMEIDDDSSQKSKNFSNDKEQSVSKNTDNGKTGKKPSNVLKVKIPLRNDKGKDPTKKGSLKAVNKVKKDGISLQKGNDDIGSGDKILSKTGKARQDKEKDKKNKTPKSTPNQATGKHRKKIQTPAKDEKCKPKSTPQPKSSKKRAKSKRKDRFEDLTTDSDSNTSLRGRLRKNSKQSNVVPDDDLQKIVDQNWALQGSVFVLNDDLAEGNQYVLRRSLRSVLTPNKSKLLDEIDEGKTDEDEHEGEDDTETSPSDRKGNKKVRRSKMKITLTRPVVFDESSGDSLYDPKLSGNCYHGDIILPSTESLDIENRKAFSEIGEDMYSEALSDTGKNSDDSDHLPDPKTPERKPINYLQSISNSSVKTESTISSLYSDHEKSEHNFEKTRSKTKKCKNKTKGRKGKVKVKDKMSSAEKTKPVDRDWDVKKVNYMDKVVKEQERILEIIKKQTPVKVQSYHDDAAALVSEKQELGVETVEYGSEVEIHSSTSGTDGNIDNFPSEHNMVSQSSSNQANQHEAGTEVEVHPSSSNESTDNKEVIYLISGDNEDSEPVLCIAEDGVSRILHVKDRNFFDWAQTELLANNETCLEGREKDMNINSINSLGNVILLSNNSDFGNTRSSESICSFDPADLMLGEEVTIETMSVKQENDSDNDENKTLTSQSDNSITDEEKTLTSEGFNHNSGSVLRRKRHTKSGSITSLSSMSDLGRQIYDGDLKTMSDVTIPAIGTNSNVSNESTSVIGGESNTLNAYGVKSNTSTVTTSSVSGSDFTGFSSDVVGVDSFASEETVSAIGGNGRSVTNVDEDYNDDPEPKSKTDMHEPSVDVKKICTDSNGIRFLPDYDDRGETNSGLIFYNNAVIPYVLVNGYKFTILRDVLPMFVGRCQSKCLIPKNVLRKYPDLPRTFCTWEQVFLLDQLICSLPRGSVLTGEMMLRFDTVLAKMADIKQVIKERHRNTRLKKSQGCRYD